MGVQNADGVDLGPKAGAFSAPGPAGGVVNRGQSLLRGSRR